MRRPTKCIDERDLDRFFAWCVWTSCIFSGLWVARIVCQLVEEDGTDEWCILNCVYARFTEIYCWHVMCDPEKAVSLKELEEIGMIYTSKMTFGEGESNWQIDIFYGWIICQGFRVTQPFTCWTSHFFEFLKVEFSNNYK